MIPRAIHQVWLGDRPPPLRWMSTWQQAHPAWDYRLWGEQDFGWLANQHLFDQLVEAGVYDAASDVARIEVLHRYGGVYVDADSVSLRPMDRAPFLRSDFFCVQEIPPSGRWMVSNCFMGCVPGHPIARRYIALIARSRIRCIHGHEGAAFCCAWRITGPLALTKLVRGTDATILEPWAFYTRTIKGEPLEGRGWGEHFWSSTGERSPVGEFPGAVSYEEAM